MIADNDPPRRKTAIPHSEWVLPGTAFEKTLIDWERQHMDDHIHADVTEVDEVAEELPVSALIRNRLEKAAARYYAGDNIAQYIEDGEHETLVEELTEKFTDALRSLVIDVERDPNSQDTGRRMAKMYIYELMRGRYYPKPAVTAFPNDDPRDRYTGMLNTRCEILSMCSHHHQPVRGTCFIGLIPGTRVIGLSKYTRIAQWCARRGTLQEELCRNIAEEIEAETGTKDFGIYIECQHGCMINRGVEVHNSLTQTSILSGQFFNPAVKNEWLQFVNSHRNV